MQLVRLLYLGRVTFGLTPSYRGLGMPLAAVQACQADSAHWEYMIPPARLVAFIQRHYAANEYAAKGILLDVERAVISPHPLGCY